MLLGQRHFSRAMTFAAVLFRLFFIYGQKLLVMLVMGKMSRGLWRRIPEKEENSCADRDKKQIVQQNIFFLFFVRHEQSRMLRSHFQGLKIEQPDAEEEDEQLHQKQGAGWMAGSKADDPAVLLLAAEQSNQCAVIALRIENQAGGGLAGNDCRINALASQSGGQSSGIADQPRCPELMPPVIVIDQGGLTGQLLKLAEAVFFSPANQAALQSACGHPALRAVRAHRHRVLMREYPCVAAAETLGAEMPLHLCRRAWYLKIDANAPRLRRQIKIVPDKGIGSVRADKLRADERFACPVTGGCHSQTIDRIDFAVGDDFRPCLPRLRRHPLPQNLAADCGDNWIFFLHHGLLAGGKNMLFTEAPLDQFFRQQPEQAVPSDAARADLRADFWPPLQHQNFAALFSQDLGAGQAARPGSDNKNVCADRGHDWFLDSNGKNSRFFLPVKITFRNCKEKAQACFPRLQRT
ncbi:hypothetical protein GCAAIG_06675 [Candidatus Electronema halotolerans]